MCVVEVICAHVNMTTSNNQVGSMGYARVGHMVYIMLDSSVYIVRAW